MLLKKYKHLLIFALVILLIVVPLFSSKYILTLDTIIAPNNWHGVSSFEDFIYGIKSDPDSGEIGIGMNKIPLLITSVLAQEVLSTSILQKIEIFLIFFLSMLSMYSLVQTKSNIPRYLAAFLYAINPFVYLRFMAGHWLILLAYAVLHFLLKELLEKRRASHLILWLSLIAVFSKHMLIIGFLLFFVFLRKAELKKYVIVLLFFLIINTYWILPAFTATSSSLSTISGADVVAFETNQTFSSLFLSVAMLYGFWREQAYLIPNLWFILPIFGVIVYLIVEGFQSKQLKHKKQLLTLLGLSFLIILGTSHPATKQFFLNLFDWLFFMKGFREPHKFAAVLALIYALVAGYGLQALQNKKLRYGLLIIPFLFTPMMLWGFNGQLQSIEYPGDYHLMNGILNPENTDGSLLFLPWHLYLDFSWIENRDRRIANPAQAFFDIPTIHSDTIDLSPVENQPRTAMSAYIYDNLNNSITVLSQLNVQYVLVAKEFDRNVPDGVLVKETNNLKLYRNPQKTSLFMQTDDFVDFEPLGYRKNSLISYEIEKPHHAYVVFAHTYNKNWWLGSEKPMLHHPVNVYEFTGQTKLSFVYANIIFFGYFVSIVGLLFFLFTWKKKILLKYK